MGETLFTGGRHCSLVNNVRGDIIHSDTGNSCHTLIHSVYVFTMAAIVKTYTLLQPYIIRILRRVKMVLLSSPSQPAPTSSTVTRRRSKRRIKSHEPSIRGRDQLDDELRQMLDPVSSRLNNDIIGTTEAAEAFTAVFREHLIHNGLLKDEANGSHRDRQIVRMKNTLAQAKNRLRQNFHRLPGKFLNAVRTQPSC